MIIESTIDKVFIANKLLGKSGKINSNLIRHYGTLIKKWIPAHLHHLDTAEALYWIYHELNDYPNACGCGNKVTAFFSFQHGYNRSLYCEDPNCQVRKTERNKKIGENSKSYTSEAIEKRDKTNLALYGGHPAKNKMVKAKIVATNLNRYGVVSNLCLLPPPTHMSDPNIQAKIRANMMEKYGVEWSSQIPATKEKMKKTNLTRYGHIIGKLSYPEIREKAKNTKEKRNNIKIDTLLHVSNVELLNNYRGFGKYHNFKCKTCGNIFKKLFLTRSILVDCPTCFPVSQSKWENSIEKFLNELNVKYMKNTRKIIQPKELDFYLPDFKLAIEVNGLYYHSEFKGGKDKTYHLNKTLACEKAGITLLHFFEDELKYKMDIIKSIILSKLGKNVKIGARTLQCKQIFDKNLVNDFLNRNHLQGKSSYNTAFGLFSNDELLMLITIVTPRFQKDKNAYEIGRLCTKQGITVVGGISKLLTNIEKDKQLISYVDRRFGKPSALLSIGFTLDSITSPASYYIKNNQRFHRLNFTKQKLIKILNYNGENKSEKELAILAKLDRIWDCGTYKLILNPAQK